jgi:hypothetical protein
VPAGGKAPPHPEKLIVKTVHPSLLLKIALMADAVVSGATGLLQLTAANPLATLLDLPRAGLLATGEFLVIYALLLVVLATRERLWSGLVMFIVLGNVAWALGCVALLLAGMLSPTAPGIGFVLMQAVAVVVFAVLEWRGLGRSLPADTPVRAVMS